MNYRWTDFIHEEDLVYIQSQQDIKLEHPLSIKNLYPSTDIVLKWKRKVTKSKINSWHIINNQSHLSSSKGYEVKVCFKNKGIIISLSLKDNTNELTLVFGKMANKKWKSYKLRQEKNLDKIKQIEPCADPSEDPKQVKDGTKWNVQ